MSGTSGVDVVPRFRLAEPSDAPRLARVFLAACQQGYRGIVADEHLDAQDPVRLTNWFGDLLAAEGSSTLVAQSPSREVLGFVRFGADPASDAPVLGYIAALYVHPSAAGVGMGAALLAEALSRLAAAGRVDVSLSVLRDNPAAVRLYTRAGFRPAGPSRVDDFWHAAQLPMRWHEPNPAGR